MKRRQLTRRQLVSALGITGGAVGAGLLIGCGGKRAAPVAPIDARQPVASGSGPAGADAEIPHTSNGYIRGYEPDLAPTPQGPVSGKPSAPPGCNGHPTEDNIEGPFYRASAPERPNLRPPGAKGKPLLLTGRVMSAACAPIAGALLDFWQANDAGEYDHSGFTFRGKVRTGDDGRYSLATIIPGRYLNGPQYRPAHIHVKVSAPGKTTLTTQLYFAGDPFNKVDPFIKQSLVMSIEVESGGATFDFTLA